MSDKIYGKCTRCGGNLTIGHICTGSKNHAEFNKSLNLANELLNLEQQNESLLAQVEELREKLESSYEEIMAFKKTIFARHRWINATKKIVANTAQQSLDSLKARIEEETIDRCVDELIGGGYVKGKHEKDDDIVDVLENMPRKYQPSNDTKAGK